MLDKSNTASKAFQKSSSQKQKFDLLVSTPMRLVHALRKSLVTVGNVRWVVLDEADRLFENGFEHQIDEIIAVALKAPF